MKYIRQTYQDDHTVKTSDRRKPGKFPGGLLFILLVLVIPLLQCKQPYNSPYVSPTTGYLVVEGYISGNTPTSFMLSRTIKLSADTTNPQELGAIVEVEGNDNSVYPLTEQGGGVYSADTLPLNASTKYRVRIRTTIGGIYLSDFAQYKVIPLIDSVSWVAGADGVAIYVNTHDDGGNTRYYQWNYDETWEYHSAQESLYEYIPPSTVEYRPPQDEIYRCWRNRSSSNILIATSAKLSKDVIYLQKLNEIAENSEQISVLYSTLVRQYALTDSGYNYLSLMRGNTESLGTIFDPQPSQLTGNIHCLTNSNEPVIGYVSAGTVQQQRIFIRRSEISSWYYAFSCAQPDTVVSNQPDSLIKYFYTESFIPLEPGSSHILVGWYANQRYCVDCTVQGGTTIDPSFWPN